MDISVVIPTFNRSKLLERTMPALMKQNTRQYSYEVIFVSNGSTDGTGEFLESVAAEHPERLRYFRIEPTGGPSAPRNYGIREARGRAVIILDDDVEPAEDLVFHHAQFHEQFPDARKAALGQLYIPDDMLKDPMSVFHMFPYDSVSKLDRLHYLHFWTCHVSVKRQFMLEKGMFDERFLFFEDVLCGHKLETNGMELHFLPGANGKHLHQLKPAGVANKGLFIGRWLYPFEQRVPERAVREKFGIFTWDLSPRVLATRIVNRVGFQFVANPVTLGMLRLLGAESGVRSRVSDLYYYTIFRRNMLRGYREARSQARANLDQAAQAWSDDRGEG